MPLLLRTNGKKVFTPAFAVVRIFLPFNPFTELIPASGLTMTASVPAASITPTEMIGAPWAAKVTMAAHDPYAK